MTGGLGSLVMRVLDDIPADEQRAIRAACLFRVFDTALIAAAADVDHGCAERAVTRPMIERHDGGRFPYRMHDAVREAIRRTDHQVTGGWSERDWELAATRAAVATREMHDAAKKREDNGEVLDAIGIAIELVCEQNTTLEPSPSASYVDWLSRAVVFSPSVQGLRARVPAKSKTDYGRHVLSFITAKSLDASVEDRLRLLREVSRADHPLRRVAHRHLGYTLKSQCRWEEALAVFDELVEEAPSELHLGQRPQVLSTARRFVDARDAAVGLRVRGLDHSNPGVRTRPPGTVLRGDRRQNVEGCGAPGASVSTSRTSGSTSNVGPSCMTTSTSRRSTTSAMTPSCSQLLRSTTMRPAIPRRYPLRSAGHGSSAPVRPDGSVHPARPAQEPRSGVRTHRRDRLPIRVG